MLSSIEFVEIYPLNCPELVFGRNLVCRDPDQNTYLAARGVVTLRDEAFAVRSTNLEDFYGHLGRTKKLLDHPQIDSGKFRLTLGAR